jgi:hypothetical protein
MSEWVENAEERDYKLYTWCILEVMEPCVDYKCSTCKLHDHCGGRMKPVMERAYKDQRDRGIIELADPPIMGFNTVEDTISKVQLAEGTTFDPEAEVIDIEADLFCKKPSRLGLVYKEYDSNIHGVPDMQICRDVREIADIPIGQFVMADWERFRTFDFGLDDPMVILDCFRDRMGRVYVYDEIYVRGMTELDIAPQLTNGIRYTFQVGDISAKGPRKNLGSFGIAVQAYSQGINDGLVLVRNQMKYRTDGTVGLYVNKKNCPYTNWELSSAYKYPNKSKRDVPEDLNNHACFVAGTLITTDDGYKAIENVRIGDRVLTRSGYRRVIDSACTGFREVWSYQFSDGTVLAGTPDHPVITEQGKVALDALNSEDQILTQGEVIWERRLRQWISTEWFIGDTRDQGGYQTGDISDPIHKQSSEDSRHYIGRFGNISMGLSPMDITYIILTGITPTTIYQIWNACQVITILVSMLKNTRQRFHKRCVMGRRHGIGRQLVENGIESMESRLGWVGNLESSFVTSAERNSRHLIEKRQHVSVPTIAKQATDGKQGKIEKRELVNTVEQSSSVTNTQKHGRAPVHVVGKYDGRHEKVFNLTVEDVHEYYANGILVSNCDALRYLIYALRRGRIRQSNYRGKR